MAMQELHILIYFDYFLSLLELSELAWSRPYPDHKEFVFREGGGV